MTERDLERAQIGPCLLVKKLSDIELSTANVDPADAWEKQILHVMAYTAAHGDTSDGL